MCGIAGFWSQRPLTIDKARERITAMRDALEHRGPDDSGFWIDGPLAFGHRRLSILDLSPLGHQPMRSGDGRWTLCYNGEIYNYRKLRDELARQGHAFRGGSDTEVMLAAFAEWGVLGAVSRFIGMFAFAVWDAHEGALHLVRDRIGIKPLYVGRTSDGDIVFGSELKALMVWPTFERRIDTSAALHFLRYAYVPAPESIFCETIKLPPGHSLSLVSPSDPFSARPYWSLVEAASAGRSDPFSGDEQEAIDDLHTLLTDAVGSRMVADVPLGAFLSGGIDSSLVVALMQAQSGRPVRTFTIGFREARFDESTYARTVAERLGTDHTEHRVTPEEAQGVVPSLPTMYDEPLADVSQIPTALVSRLARKHVTVALTGDGGDEFFEGYQRYRFAPRAWRWVGTIPMALRRPGARLLRSVAFGGVLKGVGTTARLQKIADILETKHQKGLYQRLVSTDANPLALTTFPREVEGVFDQLLVSPAARSAVERMMLADAAVYLPDDLLTKLDRASMAVGLEGRVPLLDHRVAEFAWRLPGRLRRKKLLLRRILARYLPVSAFERPKMGFEVPVGAWLRGPLRTWAQDTLARRTLSESGIFVPQVVDQILRQHLDERRDAGHLLWSLLMFEGWRRQWNAHL